MSRRAALTAALLLALVLPAAAAAAPRASLTDIENDVMCVSCREPLALAQSPQAYAERNFIRHLIDQGLTKPQIEQALVGQYGTAVLAKPPAKGFNLVVYVVPVAVVVLGLVVLALALPRWRRRGSDHDTQEPPPSRLAPQDEARLERDLARADL